MSCGTSCIIKILSVKLVEKRPLHHIRILMSLTEKEH
nr:MAG TPA: hypothetical protein [Caudoviricetes sp.]